MKQILRAARLVDGLNRSAALSPILGIEAGRIVELRSGSSDVASEAADLADVTLLPGLIDTHLHLVCNPRRRSYFDPNESRAHILLRAVGNAQSLLRAGVTTAGDCGGPNDVIFPLRDAISDGTLQGPRIVASGAPIVIRGGHGAEFAREADTRDELLQAVDEQIAAGADFIKIMATGGGGDGPGTAYYSAADLRAVVERAADAGKRVAAHAHGCAGIRNCVEAGIQRIEHSSFFGNEGAEFDEGLAREIAAREIHVSPTNVIDYRRIQQGGVGAPRALLNRNWRAQYELGVKFAASSDAGVTDMFCDDYALIPELMVSELGMTPEQAISACTRTAAETLGVASEIGSLEIGKNADIVAVKGNPLDDITTLRRIVWVMRGGRVIYKS